MMENVIKNREEWLVTKSVLCDAFYYLDFARNAEEALGEEEMDDIQHCLQLLNEFLNAYIPAE